MNKKNCYCIYNSKNWDSIISVGIVLSMYPDSELIPLKNPGALKIDRIHPNSRIYVIGLTLNADHMVLLNKKCFVYWMNRSAINFSDMPPIKGIRSINSSVCMLTFEHFYGFSIFPESIRLLNLYFLRDKKHELYECKAKPFYEGLKAYKLNPRQEFIQKLIRGSDKDEATKKIIDEGILILQNARLF